ncbi:azurin [Aestuariibaculum sediminum]|uniref:Azurin n=1 Tax=Aestuariibaculum sediminum TaxID=2770637 RepID=A0A8J6UHI8_9FLAO|nr:azurin [Aestuariibaculum sediminum]MBD0832951.1 azurin [Aestuariibaculum sediminum]
MKLIKYFLVSVLSVTVLVCCRGKEERKKEGFSYEEKTEESKKSVEEDVNNVVISGDDLMKFDKSEIRVKAGKKVKLTLRHTGKLDKNVMGHNFVLLKQGADLEEFAIEALNARATEYIPVDYEDQVIAHTKLIGGGETTTIEFEAPASGEYAFLCSFPGHYTMMNGKFIVD